MALLIRLRRRIENPNSGLSVAGFMIPSMGKLVIRATYEYEKKLYSDHLESLQVMETNYMTMSREVEKLRWSRTNWPVCFNFVDVGLCEGARGGRGRFSSYST
ncbi:protein flx-like 2 [Phtheirospermum japonicum]|uniref:Protein flx-like 2 n=1 Tax=Phtheirospermum japonicum TaxID=374723 RepID=A0A830CUM3_9LAMI|nr:protein flx-like 2 [Phtheirospermum japonicum]